MALTGYSIITPDASQFDDFVEVDSWAFMFEPRAIDREATARVLPWERARVTRIDDATKGKPGSFAGVYASTVYGMRIPGGGVLPVSGLTWVGVHPGHRRRGILRAMIDDHFAATLAAGESVSTLYAMETGIYGRFGYGSAAPRLRLTIGDLVEVPGSEELTLRLERASVEEHTEVLRAVHARIERAGTMVEPSSSQLAGALESSPSELEDGERPIIAIVDDEHGPAAYAVFTRKMETDGPSPAAKLTVMIASSAHARASRRLFATLKELDLITEAAVRSIPPDDALLTLTKDIRQVKAQLTDALWLRILDVPAALQARGYGADCDLTVAVTDPQVPANAGTWRIAIVDGHARVERTDATADLELSIQDLSAAYLGSEHLRRAQIAGLLTERTPGAALALNRAMRTELEPHSNMWF